MTKRYSLILAALAGLCGAVLFIAAGLVVRLFGIPTLAELFSDRFAPLLGIPLFFKMLSLFGGYSHLKQLGFASVLLGEVLAILIAAVITPILARRTSQPISRVLAILAGASALLTLAALAPNLGTNYRGLASSSSAAANILALAAECAFLGRFLNWSLRTWTSPGAKPAGDSQLSRDIQRRELITGGATILAGTAAAAILTYFFRIAAYSYDGTENAGEDLPPITPNDKFYTVTKNNVDPRPDSAVWALKVTGAVTHPHTLRIDEIKAMPPVVREVTLQCISNSIGGGLNSNAVWKGVPLKDVLSAAGPSANAVQVTFHGADGFTDDVPFQKAMDGETLLVYEMNGSPLPLHHGFPARLIVPGYVGEKSVKWVTGIEVTEQPQKGFYEQQGWGPKFTLNNTARFDAPDFSKPVSLGRPVQLKGTAFAGDRGVSRVQVSLNGEKTWREAEITYGRAKTAWVQWRLLWKPEAAGEVMLAVRCVDGEGQMQSGVIKASAPEPATGYHRVKASVKA